MLYDELNPPQTLLPKLDSTRYGRCPGFHGAYRFLRLTGGQLTKYFFDDMLKMGIMRT